MFAFWVKEPTNERQEIGREVGVVPFVDTQDHTFGIRQLQVGFCFLDLSVRLPNQILREREEYIVLVASEFWGEIAVVDSDLSHNDQPSGFDPFRGHRLSFC